MDITIEMGQLRFKEVLKKALVIHNEVVLSNKMIFDFNNTYKYEPFAMLYIASTIREGTKGIKRSLISKKINNINADYAGNMGFFKSISPKISIGKMPGEAIGSDRYLPVTKIDISEEFSNVDSIGDAIEKRSKELAEILTQDKELCETFAFIIREIIRNSVEHSENECVWICAQYWPTYEIAEIAILDNGIGIKNSLQSNSYYKKEIIDDETALNLSILPGITEKYGKYQPKNEWSNSGFGLYMASQLCCELDGTFSIVSGNKALFKSKSSLEYIDTIHKGTAIRMTLKTNLNFNYNKLREEILSKGEEKAKKIENTIKKASESSGGLIGDI